MKSSCIINNTLPALARGVGQVMFQQRAASGVLMTLALFIAASGIGGDGRIVVFIATLAALFAATLTGFAIRFNGCCDGLAGFNAVLVGAAAFTFFNPGIWTWALAISGALLTLPLKRWLDHLLMPAVSSLTMPFVIAAWLILTVGNITGLCTPYQPESIIEPITLTVPNLAVGLLKGLSEVFLADSWLAGIIILAALAIGSLRAAIWALTGSASGIILAIVCGISPAEIVAGLWGFSPALTAVAVMTVLPRRSNQYLCLTTALLLTFCIQWLVSPLLNHCQLPVLTMPFCIATIICAYIFPTLKKSTT